MSTVCKICGGQTMKLHFVVKQIRIMKCCQCKFIQMEKSAEVKEYDYECSYFDNNKYRDNTCQNRENERRKRLILQFLPSNKKIIDVGCASGEFVSYVNDTFDIYGCDFASNAIELAQRKHPEMQNKFWVSSAKDLQLGDELYDAVCMWDVIEHIDEPRQALENVLGLLKEDGYIFLSTPDIGALFAKMMRKKWPFMTPPEHLSFFNKSSIHFLAKKIGLTVVKRFDKGKWANFGFILYKINRIMPGIIPDKIVNKFKSGKLSKLNVYVPTHDIQYVVLKKDK